MKIITEGVHQQMYYSIEKALACFVRLFLYEGVAWIQTAAIVRTH